MPAPMSSITPTDPPVLFDETDEELVLRAARKRVRYFAYGSNADQDQMLARCPSARLLGTGVLRDHCLVFAGHSASRGGAVATVFACAGVEVHGALYSLTREDLAMLDGYEGVPWMYTRGARWIETKKGKRRAQVYWLQREQVAMGIRRPAPAYLGLIGMAYRRLGIPRDSLSLALEIAERIAHRRPTPSKPRGPETPAHRTQSSSGAPKKRR